MKPRKATHDWWGKPEPRPTAKPTGWSLEPGDFVIYIGNKASVFRGLGLVTHVSRKDTAQVRFPGKHWNENLPISDLCRVHGCLVSRWAG